MSQARTLKIMTTSARILITTITYLTLAVFQSDALTCYRCTILGPQYVGELHQPCAEFDESSKFYIECPSSTFCMKRIIHLKVHNGSVETYERDCAPQKYVYQNYNHDEKKWHSEETVDKDAYKEGCFKEEDRGTPTGPSEYCYCSGNYCNKSSQMTNPLQICSLLVFAIILVLRFA